MTSEAVYLPSSQSVAMTSHTVHIPLAVTSEAAHLPSGQSPAMTSEEMHHMPCTQSVVMNVVSNNKEESFIVKIADGLITSTNRITPEDGMGDSTKSDDGEPEVIVDAGDNLMSLVTEACRDTQSANSASTSTDREEAGPPSNCYWNRDCSLQLIDLHTRHRALFSDQHYKKKTVWEMVARTMRERGCQYTWHQVESKWKSMTKKFRDTVDHNERNGHVSIHTCSYFSELAAAYRYKPDVVKMTLEAEFPNSGAKAVAGGNYSTATKRPADEVESEDRDEVEEVPKKKKYVCNGSVGSSGNSRTSSEQSFESTPELFRFLRNLHNDRKRHDAANMTKIENMHKEKMAVFRSFLDIFKNFVEKQSK
ncbi:uncharacterized protein LOC121386503 [Gigantopelta aegis]|uniref:uncharacterized protein LOC121386503 n=1 Tax=Gigantopelta aegis TaxID=1735272 RepID=UPI001B88C0EA|nr:uncharacterized protein LOC121386503 [Gigantopelta aegis]